MTDRVQTIQVTLLDGTRLEGGWVDLFSLGRDVHYRGEVVKMDQSRAARLLANFTRYLALYGKEPVMLRQHEREGWQYGVWRDLRVHEGKIQGLAAFLDARVLEMFKAGQLREWSPGFGDVEDPHTGEILQDMMVEASFVDRGHQWDLRPPSMTNPVTLASVGTIHLMESIMETNESPAEETQVELEAPTEEEEESFDMAAAFSALTTTLNGMAENMAKLASALEPPAEEEEEPAAEMAALRAEVAQLRYAAAISELAAKGITGAVAEGLIELKSASPSKYAATVAEVEKRFDTPVAKVQAPIGVTGSAKVGGPTAAEALATAANAGVTYGNGLAEWAATHHPELRAEIVSLARAQR